MTNPRFRSLRFFVALLVGALCYPVTIFVNGASVSAQSVGEMNVFEIFDNLLVVFSLLFMVALLPNRAVELIKPVVHNRIPETSGGLRVFVLLLLSLVFGMVTAIVLNLNVLLMFPDSPILSSAPEWAGVLLTGFLLMFDANVWHELGEAIQRREDVIEGQARSVQSKPLSGGVG